METSIKTQDKDDDMEDLLSSVELNQDWEGLIIVDVDHANLSDDFTFETAMRYLSLAYQLKIRQRKTEKARRIALCNRLLQLFGCSVLGEIPFEEVQFEYGSHGKPYLKHSPAISFGMSNGEQYVVQFILRQKGTGKLDVGIDIAAKSDYIGHDDVEVFRNIFSEREYNHFKACGNKLKPSLFAYYWSLKECYTKYTGLGLNYDLSRIDCGEVDVPVMSARLQCKMDEDSILFHSTWVEPDCEEIITVCRQDSDQVRWLQNGPRVYRISLLDILSFFEKTPKRSLKHSIE